MQDYIKNKIAVRKYDSISEFEEYISNTPLNSVFRWAKLGSTASGGHWAGTSSYEEAADLLKHGADDLSKRLEKAYQVKAATLGIGTVRRSFYDVAGYQVSVPRMLQGLPTTMVNQKAVPQKQKVVTLNKDMSYNAGFSTEQIIEESAKALAVVKKLEADGFRVNLNLVFVALTQGNSIACVIRLKNASERLNVSKMAFAMAHPSMLRRMLFRWTEVNPDVTNKHFISSYGAPGNPKDVIEKGEYLLPRTITDIDAVVKNFGIEK